MRLKIQLEKPDATAFPAEGRLLEILFEKLYVFRKVSIFQNFSLLPILVEKRIRLFYRFSNKV